MIRTPDRETVVVFRGHPMKAEMVHELLKGHEIISFINNELMGSIAPWQVSAGGFQPVEIVINKKDELKAISLIEEFQSAT
ncbi:putative signal transducing protein [Sunxiuqinia indica]|uniref:putative signal transducing protein n=1 Tax=Sunxiuqinia indica TaxID=2692584 RepID=UPI001F2BDE5C|nr:DUF2007 domain-containing protein [Sunxiuqinia indica]